MTVHHQLAAVLQKAVQAAQSAGALPSFDPPEITIERPREASFGDYASPTPLKLARDARMAPIKIAQAIVDHLPTTDYIQEVTVAPPGFINIRLTEARSLPPCPSASAGWMFWRKEMNTAVSI